MKIYRIHISNTLNFSKMKYTRHALKLGTYAIDEIFFGPIFWRSMLTKEYLDDAKQAILQKSDDLSEIENGMRFNCHIYRNFCQNALMTFKMLKKYHCCQKSFFILYVLLHDYR